MRPRSNLALSIALLLLCAFHIAPARGETFSRPVKLNWLLAPSDKVGSKKSGIACLPNGALQWHDLARPEVDLLAERLQALVEASPIATLSAQGDIVSIKAALCSAWLGMGRQPKSEIQLSIRWSLQSGDRQFIETGSSNVQRKAFDLRTNADLLMEAVEASLKEVLVNIRRLDLKRR